MTLAELCGEPLLPVPPGGGLRTVLDETCTAHGLTYRVALEANSPVLLASLAAQGLGVALVPASFAASFAGSSAPGTVHPLRIVRPGLVGRCRCSGGGRTPPRRRARSPGS